MDLPALRVRSEQFLKEFRMTGPLDKDGKPMVCQHSQLARQCGYCERDEEIARLRNRLEIDPRHSYDGIDSRDETIKLMQSEIEHLRARIDGPGGYLDQIEALEASRNEARSNNLRNRDDK